MVHVKQFTIVDDCYDAAICPTLEDIMLHIGPNAFLDVGETIPCTIKNIQNALADRGVAKVYYAGNKEWSAKIRQHKTRLIQKLSQAQTLALRKMAPGKHGNGAVDMIGRLVKSGPRLAMLRKMYRAGLVFPTRSERGAFWSITEKGIAALEVGEY
jgi:hypothetical protein